MSNDPVIEALEAIYAELPTVECRGLCWNSCGPIAGGDDPVVRPQLLALLARRTNEVRGRDGDVSVLPDEQSR